MGNVSPHYLLSRFVDGAELPFVERHHTWFGCLDPARIDGILAPDLRRHLADDDPWGSARSALDGTELPDDLSRALYSDFVLYLQDDLLTKVDRSTMLASLEARAPFLDHELAQFAAALPSGSKVSGWTTKAILRRATRERLPREVLGRRKRGFNIPFSRWLLAGLRDEMERRLAPEAVARRGLLDPEAVARLWAEHTSRQRDHRKPLFALLALDLWCDRIFGEGAAVPVAVGSEESIGPVELAV
jgi:asparagine synthase (glutamine-hydrolysing)